MNTTYQTIWNESLGAWVAASEGASLRGKKSRSKTALAGAVTVALLALAGGASAQQITEQYPSFYSGWAKSVTLTGVGAGNDSAIPGNADNTALGFQAGADVRGSDNTATGSNAGTKTQGSFNTATGSYAGTTVQGSNNTTSGFRSGSDLRESSNNAAYGSQTGNGLVGNSNTAIGNDTGNNVIGSSNIAIGAKTGNRVEANYTISIGAAASATAEDAVVIGREARAGASSSLALGASSIAEAQKGDVALGSGSLTGPVINTAGITINGVRREFARPSAESTVSVGNSETGVYRTITNLAPGQINSESTDAINGSQLNATNLSLEAMASGSTQLGNTTAASLGGTSSYDESTGILTTALSLPTTAGTTYTSTQGALTALASGAARQKYIQVNSILGDSVASGVDTVAVGPGATASKASAIAIGAGAIASGTQSISIGTGNRVSGNNSGAIGDPNVVTGNEAYALGNNNTIAQNNTFVVGNGVTTTQANSVVLGNASTDRAATAQSGITLRGTAYTFAGVGSAANGVVSMGGVGTERQVINVAAGAVNSTSTDAVNGSQLAAVSSALATTASNLAASGLNFSGNTGAPVNRALGETLAITGTATTAGTYSGANIQSIADSATGAINLRMADAPRFGSIVLNSAGTGVITGLSAGAVNATSTEAVTGAQLFATNQMISSGGASSKYVSVNSTLGSSSATGANSIAIGPVAVAGAANAVAIGNGAAAAANAGDVALGAGSTTAAVVNTAGTAINGTNYVFAGIDAASTVSVGGAGTVRTLTNVAAGQLSAGSTNAVNGSQLFATNAAISAIGASVNGFSANVASLGLTTAATLGGGATYNAVTGAVSAPSYTVYGTATSSVGAAVAALQSNAPIQYSNTSGVATPTARSNDVTLVGAAAGPVAIHNLAPGVAPTDAVNVGQLGGGLAGAVAQANQYTDAQTARLSSELTVNKRDTNAGIAGAMAVASMPQASAAGKSMVAVGVGGYGGQSSIAIGVSRLAENGKWVLKLNGTADSRGKVGVGAGAGFHW